MRVVERVEAVGGSRVSDLRAAKVREGTQSQSPEEQKVGPSLGLVPKRIATS